MTLNYEQLMQTNLKGYKYFSMGLSMTATSRNAYTTEYYVVIEDNGESCVVAELNNKSYTRTLSKSSVAESVANRPLMRFDRENNTNVNDVE